MSEAPAKLAGASLYTWLMAYMGFAKVQKSVEKEGYSKKTAGAITASIGRKKYGAKRMASMAAEGRKRAKGG